MSQAASCTHRRSDDLPCRSGLKRAAAVLRVCPAAYASYRPCPTPGGVGALSIPDWDENRVYRDLSGTVYQIGAAITGEQHEQTRARRTPPRQERRSQTQREALTELSNSTDG